jgi:ABC-type glycerol-3-phosphate transport system permease component
VIRRIERASTEPQAQRRARGRGARRRAWRLIAGHAAAYAVLLVLAVIFAFPLVWMISTSFKPTGDIFNPGLTLLPTHATLDNYRFAFNALPLLRNFFNSVFIATATTGLSLFVSSLAGFAFAKLDFPGKRGLFLIMLGTLMVPGLVGLLPSFVIISKLGWVDTYQAVIVPGIASAFGIFFMRQYIQSIPDELLDAARIDGLPDYGFGLYWRIVVPLIKPALATLSIIGFLGSWNNFLWPLLVLRSNTMYTIVLAVAALPSSQFNTPYGPIMAGTTIAVLPLIILFLVFQRQFVAGVMRVGLKG